MTELDSRKSGLARIVLSLASRRPALTAALASSGWLFADRAVRLLVGFVIGVVVARHLTPAGYGALNYAIAFVALFSVLTGLGLEMLLVRELVRHPEQQRRLLGTAAVLRLVGGGCALVTALTISLLLHPDDMRNAALVTVLCLAPLFQAMDVVETWFQSRVAARPVVLARSVAFLAASTLKLGLVFYDAPLVAFAWAMTGEAGVSAVALLWAYRRAAGIPSRWCFDASTARRLMSEAWPAAVSSLSVLLYTRIDQVMIGEMAGLAEVGSYSVAVRFTEMWYAVPVLVTTALFPAIVVLRSGEASVFDDRLRILFTTMVWSAVVFAAVTAFAARWVVPMLFGDAYRPAVEPLIVLVWVLVFVFPSTVRSHWFVAEGAIRHGMAVGIVIAVLNVALNFLLIPKYGATGAAIASLIAYPGANLLVAPFSMPVRRSLVLFVGALVWPVWALLSVRRRTGGQP